MILPLHEEEGKSWETSQVPFHEDGRGEEERDGSEKLLSSGQIPVSRTPMMTSEAKWEFGHRPEVSASPRKSGVWVVWRWRIWSGWMERTSGWVVRWAA